MAAHDLVADRAKNAEGERDHDKGGEHRHTDGTDEVRHHFFDPLVHIGEDPDHQNDRDRCLGVVDQLHGQQAIDLEGLSGRHDVQHGGVQHQCCHQHGKDRVGLEALGCAVSHEEGQEVKACIIDQVAQDVQLAFRRQQAQVLGPEQHRHHLEDTGHDYHRQHRGQAATDGTQDIVGHRFGGQLLFFLRELCFGSRLCCMLQADPFAYDIVNFIHITADHDLDLPACADHLQNTCNGFQRFIVRCFALVHKHKAQPGHAMGHAADICLAAHCRKHLFSNLLIVCHDEISFTCSPRKIGFISLQWARSTIKIRIKYKADTGRHRRIAQSGPADVVPAAAASPPDTPCRFLQY